LTEGKKAKRGKKQDDMPKQGSDGSDNELDGTIENGVDEDDWAVDVSAEAVKARMEDLSSGVKGLTISDDLEKTPKERADLFYSYVKRRVDDGIISKAGVDKDIVTEADRLDVKDKAPLILCELIFNGQILSQIKTHCALLSRFTRDNKKAQKYLLGGIECVIQLHQDTLLPKVSHILKSFYDYDILEEEVLIEWGAKPSRKYVSKELSVDILAKAAPFITWLKEAEEETEDSDDSDVEIEYDDRTRSTSLKEQHGKVVAPVTKLATENEDDEAELDIDAI